MVPTTIVGPARKQQEHTNIKKKTQVELQYNSRINLKKTILSKEIKQEI